MEFFHHKMDEIGVMAKDTLINHKTEKVFQLKEIRRKQFDETMDEATAQYMKHERLDFPFRTVHVARLCDLCCAEIGKEYRRLH